MVMLKENRLKGGDVRGNIIVFVLIAVFCFSNLKGGKMSRRWKNLKFVGIAGLILGLLFFPIRSFALTSISASPNPASTPGRVGMSYTDINLSTSYESGESGEVTWSITSESLPSGLSLIKIDDLHARITGTPTSSGNFSFTVTADIGTGNDRTYSSTIHIEPALGSISPSSLPNGTLGVAYTRNLNVSGGSGNFTWSIDGELPPGLSLTYSGSSATISGTPTQYDSDPSTPGNQPYDFTIIVTDNNPPTTFTYRPYSLTIDPPPFIPIVNEGQICYVKNVVRGTDGEITSTGDLYVKNLETNDVRQITDFATGNPNGVILNPQFTQDGSQILFTYSTDPSTDNFAVYLTSTNSTLTDPSQAKLDFLPDVNIKYAALSPNSDGKSTGLLAYTYERSDRTELWVYNFATGLSTQVKTEKGLEIKYPVFVDDLKIAYVGIKNGIQDIYIINADGGTETNITNNTPTTPQYGRLLSSSRNPNLTTPYLIYAKRVWDQFGYGKWDIYIKEVGGSYAEYNVTNTSDMDELAPAFFGDDTTSVILGSQIGQMFYEAEILADRDIWQANYDVLTPSNSNVSKSQRTVETGVDFGLPNWSPVPVVEVVTDYVDITQTRFVYSDGSDIYRADYNGANSTQLTTTTTGGNTEPNLARNGGTIVYTHAGATQVINKMNHDGTGNSLFASDPSLDLKEASISPDGRWVVYAKQVGTNQWDVVVKNIIGGAETVIDNNGGAHYADIESIYFNPDMTKIVYAVQDSVSGHWDIVVTDVVVDNIAGTITPGTPTNITNTANINEQYPSFSNDGRKIIFVSDMWDNRDQIFTMNTDGSGVELVVADPTDSYTFAYPVYGPVYDSRNNADAIAYIKDDGVTPYIYYAYVYRDSSENPGATSGTNPVFGETSTGISTSGKFGWGILREKGTVVARRYLPDKGAASIPLEYDIIVDVDEASVPSSFTINEILPSGFTVNSVTREGGTAVTYSTMTDTPSTGLQTLKILFTSGYNGGVADHVLRINLTPTTDGSYSVSGTVNYNLNGSPTTSSIGGNSTIDISAPFMPVDIYDPDDTDSDGNTNEPNGIIEDYDLLYAIDSWALDKQLQGYGPAWPQDINNWDNIILAVIDIWADDDGEGHICYDDNSGFAKVTDPGVGGSAQSHPGEYVFIGNVGGTSAPDLYDNDGGDDPPVGVDYPEMYWTKGAWGSL